MIISHIKNATRVAGEAQGYLGLPIRDVMIADTVNGPKTPAMETAWLPTPEEIAAIAAGAPIIVRILGRLHPPIMLEVDEVSQNPSTSPDPDAAIDAFRAAVNFATNPQTDEGLELLRLWNEGAWLEIREEWPDFTAWPQDALKHFDLVRVGEIDARFKAAMGWGSWMVMAANEREQIVNRLRAQGVDIEHKYQTRLGDGSCID